MRIPLLSGRFSLKTKTSLSVTLLFILFSCISGYLGERYLGNTIKETIHTEQFSYVSSLAQSIDDKLELVQNALVASASQLGKDVVVDHDKAQGYLDSQLSLKSLFNNALFLFSADGRLIAESPFIAGRRNRDISYRDYFRTTMATGKPFISDPYISTHNPDHSTVIITAPIRDRGGRIIAVLAGSFDLLGDNNILANLATMKSGKNGYVYLFMTDRTMIMHPDRSRVMKQDVQPGSNALFDKAIAGFEGSGETINSHGRHFLASFKRLKKTGWILAANFPTEEAFAPLVKARHYYSTVFAVLVVLVAVAVWFMMQRFLTPLHSMARHLQRPDFTGSRLPELFTGNDEIGTLARSFNSMVELQKRQRQELRSTDAMYADIFEHIGVGVSLISPEMKIVSMNPIMRKWFPNVQPGNSQECYMRFNGTHRTKPCSCCPTIKTLRDGKTHEAVTATPTATGIRNYKVVSSPVCDAAGSILSAIEVVEDITEHVNYQQGLKEAKQAAESANRAKSEFLANMSHEIRTPMNGILGMTQLLAYTELTTEQQEYLACIKSSGGNLLGIISDILDLSKIDANKIQLETVEFSPRICISTVTTLLMPLILQKNLEFCVDSADDIPEIIVGDFSRLQQIITNLLGNAIKFTEQGRITMAIELMDEQNGSVLLRFSVCDTGIGVAAEVIEQVFLPFEQADSSTTRKYGGTGLGLAISRRLSELMGGRIWVESTPGTGSTFFVELPFQAVRTPLDTHHPL